MAARILCFVLLAMISAVPASAIDSPENLTLNFGLYQSDKATEMYRKFTPVLEALQNSLNKSLGYPVKIEMRIYKTYKEAQDALVKGDIDFARFGPVTYILCRDRNPGITLLAMENKKGGRSFKGVIAVQTGCKAQNLADLKGHTFAFGDSSSTIGRYLAQAELLAAGVSGNDLEYQFLERHDRVAKAVAHGDFYAGALKESSYKKANKNGEMRVLISFDNVTKPWPVRAGLDQEVVEALKNALLEMTDQRALKSLKVDGFFPGEDHYYDVIRQSIQRVREF